MRTGTKCIPSTERGSALLATMILVGALAMLMFSMLVTGMSATRSVTGQDDELRLTSAVESVGDVAAQYIWSGYLRSQGGAAADLASFRAYLNGAGFADAGPGPLPPADTGTDILADVGLPLGRNGVPEFDRVRVESLRVLRRDDGEATQLIVSAVADTNRGGAGIHPLPTKAAQMVYTVEPAPFSGFDYGILSKNINCVFCHTVIDSAKRAYDTDPAHYGTFDKIKVGCLETLMLRVPARNRIGDTSADTELAGTLYTRGTATDQAGNEILGSAWSTNTAQSCSFDQLGHLIQDAAGNLIQNHFFPAGDPPQAGANLYLNYPTQYAAQPDGLLPAAFPPPFPDDGGVDPNHTGAGNKKVDPGEFQEIAQKAHGSVESGIVQLSPRGAVIATQTQLNRALTIGNQTSLQSGVSGNVILSGTLAKPIVINGTVAIDGDVVIQGWIKGTGTIVASGNVYVPGDLQYLDGRTYLPNDTAGNPTGPITFGVAQDGKPNTLGLAAGGNVLIGDFLRPSGTYDPGPTDIVTGDASGPWNFALAEIAAFNRTEWAHTQQLLCGGGEDPKDPSTWTVHNPGYIPNYVARYYEFGPGDPIPIFNLADLHFDPVKGTWLGAELAASWDPQALTIVDPADTSNPILYDPATGAPRATVLQVTPAQGWLPDPLLKNAIQSFKAARADGDPMRLDGLFYTNNAIFGMVARDDRMKGKLVVNGSLVCADLGLLSPGNLTDGGTDTVPGSPYSVGLRLNYDERTKGMLNVTNPNQVTIHRSLWRPTAAP